jgi:hypothetical protein
LSTTKTLQPFWKNRLYTILKRSLLDSVCDDSAHFQKLGVFQQNLHSTFRASRGGIQFAETEQRLAGNRKMSNVDSAEKPLPRYYVVDKWQLAA